VFQDEKFNNQASTERTKTELVVFGTLRRSSQENVSQGAKVVRAIFGLLAWALAVVAAIYAHNQSDSIWLAVFVGLLVLNFVGRGVADVITDSKKIRRAIYFLLLPACATLILWATYKWWGTWWLSVVLGLIVGQILSTILAMIFFPGIHREEKEDTMQRWRRAV
jgi:hypothetical protein